MVRYLSLMGVGLVLLLALSALPAAAQESNAVVSLTLIDADTDLPLPGYDPLPDGAVVNLQTLPTTNLNLRANTSPALVGSVVFDFNGEAGYAIESTAPYALAGDSSGDYAAWTPPQGGNMVTATPYSGAGGSGSAGVPLTINFTVTNAVNVPPQVEAGADVVAELPTGGVPLAGSAVDSDGEVVAVEWTQRSGPAAAVIDGAATLTPTLTGLVAGVYVLELSATDDSGLVAADSLALVVAEPAGSPAVLQGTQRKWHPLTLSFAGAVARESDTTPNPFLDYRLDVTLTAPSGRQLRVPGFFAGDGQGYAAGNVWQIRFAPDEVGTWQYAVSFRGGSQVAIDLDPSAGAPLAPLDGQTGSFTIGAQQPDDPGFLRWGRLAYVGGHYRKFVDGPYWIKGGTNSPENLLGYAGFDNTVDQPGGVGDGGLIDGLHRFTPHVDAWQPGDPYFVSADSGVDSKGLIGALNYLADRRVNSVYFLLMNLGGDARDTYPFISPAGTPQANTQYDLSKLHQWQQVFDHTQALGIAVNIVLAETELENELWLDNGTLGPERKLFYRELVARFGYHLALKWIVSEENDYETATVQVFAGYIAALDWAAHPIAVHNRPNQFVQYGDLMGDTRFSASSIQYNPDLAGNYVENWRENSAAAGHPWVLDMDENNPAGTGLSATNADDLRKRVLYDVYFSGGHIEWYLGYHDLPVGGDIRLEDFATREAMWDAMWHARRFMETYLPFWQMAPADDLLSGESTAYGGGEVFALPGEVYAIYLPEAAATGTLTVAPGGTLTQRWYNPRTGVFQGDETLVLPGAHSLGAPPADPEEDWVVLIATTTPTAIVTTAELAPAAPAPPLLPALLLVLLTLLVGWRRLAGRIR